MQIHELNTKALTDPAYVAFDDGADTYKADLNEVIDDAVAEAFSSADVSGGVVNYTSGDSSSPTAWSDVSVMASGSTLATLMNRISTMVKNVRYIWSKIGSSSISNVSNTITGAIGNTSISNVSSTITGAIGNTSISGIGGGTVTGAISALNSNTAILSNVDCMNLKVQALGPTSGFGTPNDTGVWYMSGVSAGSPTGSATYGILFQARSPKSLQPTTADAVYTQLFISVYAQVYVRSWNNNAWTNWKTIAS